LKSPRESRQREGDPGVSPALLGAAQGKLSDGSAAIGLPDPFGAAEQRKRAGGFGEDCLSRAAASSAAARPAEQRRGPIRRSRIGGAAGSPFLWLLSFGETKERTHARQARKKANTNRASANLI
jgi:hypothetical protein